MKSSHQKKIKSISELKKIITREKKKRKRVVFTNGCFDILHLGHVVYLEEAKRMGGVLIVGLNSDSSMRKIKGEGRPLNPQTARAQVLSALNCVDYVVIFEEPTPASLIKELVPDILVKGGDYPLEQIIGREDVKKVKTVDLVEGFSTTSLIKRIVERYGKRHR